MGLHGAPWGCSTGSGTRTLLQVLFQVSSHRSTKHNLLWRGLRSLDKSSLITEGNNPLRKTWRKTFSHAGEKIIKISSFYGNLSVAQKQKPEAVALLSASPL